MCKGLLGSDQMNQIRFGELKHRIKKNTVVLSKENIDGAGALGVPALYQRWGAHRCLRDHLTSRPDSCLKTGRGVTFNNWGSSPLKPVGECIPQGLGGQHFRTVNSDFWINITNYIFENYWMLICRIGTETNGSLIDWRVEGGRLVPQWEK